MSERSPHDARIKQMAESTLEGIQSKKAALKEKYEEAASQAGAEIPPKVQALVDAVLRYDGSQGPHGAIWHLAKAHTIALELIGPRAVIEEYQALEKREKALLDTIKAHDAGDEGAEELLSKLTDETGRPLQ